MHVLALALASALAVEIVGPQADQDDKHPTFVWLPRTFSTGIFINPPNTISLSLRTAWEVDIVAQPRNHLIAMLTLGTTLPFSTNKGIRTLWQHTAMLGIGFRSTRSTFHWGFSALTGPLWYRASYEPSTGFSFENRVVTYSEVTLQGGLRLADHFVAGIYLGYGAPWDFSRRFPASIYCGGFTGGLFVEWR